MGGFIDLFGKGFGRLIAMKVVGRGHNGSCIWQCMCNCGNIKNVRMDSLLSGAIRSCGCLNDEKRTKHGMRHTLFNASWRSLKYRCDNNKCVAYKYYGGRGITYDPRWKEFNEFKKDMYLKYLYAKKQLKIKIPTIERIDVDGDYTFDNCTFISKSDQCKNKRTSKKYKLEHEIL